MKVKDLVEQLQKLDQEKNIWVLYDLCYSQEPCFTKYEEDENDEIEAGDYVHEAW
jgi:hypothetical protein